MGDRLKRKLGSWAYLALSVPGNLISHWLCFHLDSPRKQHSHASFRHTQRWSWAIAFATKSDRLLSDQEYVLPFQLTRQFSLANWRRWGGSHSRGRRRLLIASLAPVSCTAEQNLILKRNCADSCWRTTLSWRYRAILLKLRKRELS